MPSLLDCHHVGFFTLILFRREQRRQSLSFIVAISRGNGAIGNEKQESDMEREHQIETTELKDEELEAVNGGAITGFGVRTDQRIALQQQLTTAYARSNPTEYYGYFG